MSDSPFVGEIAVFGFNFAPSGWAQCNGQLLPISQNTALFSLLGTYYGGNGKSTFALPNLQGCATVSHGQGPGLSEWFLGQETGTASITLLLSEIAVHNHAVRATSVNANSNLAAGGQFARAIKGNLQASNSGRIYSSAAPNAQMSGMALSPAGGSQPHNNMMPYLTMNFCIALQGVYPPRG